MPNRLLRGIVHVHSRYSYDGKHALSEIALAARERDLDFVCMTEHSDTLDPKKVSDFVKECEALSSPEFLMIPGIEFTCDDNLHLLGIGVTRFDSAMDPVYLNQFIQENGGISVVAHPFRKSYSSLSDLLPVVNGIEVWNCTYDGRFFPNTKALELYAKAILSNPGLSAFCGMDLHRLSNFHRTFVCLEPCKVDEREVISFLRDGRFRGVSPWCEISARPSGRWIERSRLTAQRRAYLTAKKIRSFLFPNRVGD